MPKKSFIDGALAGLALLTLAAGVYLFRDTYPLPGNRGELPKEAIAARCQALLDTLHIDVRNLEQVTTLETNSKLLAYAQNAFGTATANHLFANDLPAYYWHVRFIQPISLTEMFKSSGDNKEKETEEKLKKHFFGETAVDYDLHGRLLRFSTGFDSVNVKKYIGGVFTTTTTQEGMGERVDSLGAQTAGDSLTTMSLLQKVRRLSAFADEETLDQTKFEKISGSQFNDFRVAWVSRMATAGVRASINASVRGDKLTLWEVVYEPSQPATFSDKKIYNILSPFVYIGVVVCMVVFFFRRLRSDRMSFRAGVPTGIVCGLAAVLAPLLSTTAHLVERILPAIFLPLIILLGFMLTYAISESVMRDKSSEPIRSFEALQHRHFFFRPIGDSLWHGVIFGALAFGVTTLLVHQLGEAAGYYLDPFAEDLNPSFSYVPALSLAGTIFSNVVFGETTFRLFTISFFQRYFRSLWTPVVLSAMVAAMAKMHLTWLNPLGFMLAVNFLISILFSVAYARHGFLASVVAALTTQFFFFGMSLLYFPGEHSAFQASLLLAVPALFLAGGAVVRRHGAETIDARVLEPDYVQRLAERERMARELEIARQVQASFLPREKPVIKGLDIASLCLPAQEVGGDYYDFITFSPTRLGVLIGDVSGKGISAAFYMTLIKGIVKALVREGLAPAEVLIRANQHFYENAERGIFVSLVFGIFDLQEKEFTFARAGHNPVVIVSSNAGSPKTLAPPGIALGLEPGELFARKMVEKTVPIAPGDLFVFYTDGFTEAMNHVKEEFGEPRFAEVVHGSSKATSAGVVERLQTEVKAFAGQTPQHDDMTAIVVKVL